MPVTFHRAFDACPEPDRALRDVLGTGATRLLTSGGASNAVDGAPRVKALCTAASGSIDLLLCGGLNATNAPQAAAIAGVNQVHAALRAYRPSPAREPDHQSLDRFAKGVVALKQSMSNCDAAN